MVVIRLTRVGKKNSPAYRVVVAEKRRAVKRKFIEVIGHYNPTRKPKEVVISSERALFWLKQGAKPSDTIRNLMADSGIIPKKDKVNIKYARAKKKKEMKADKEQKEVPAKSETEGEEKEQPVEKEDEKENLAPESEIKGEKKEEVEATKEVKDNKEEEKKEEKIGQEDQKKESDIKKK